MRVLFSTLTVPDDADIFGTAAFCAASIITPLLSNPRRYAQTVKSLVICDSDFSLWQANGTLSVEKNHRVDPPEIFRPIEAYKLSLLLEVCLNLEEFVWESSIPPPDGICEVRDPMYDPSMQGTFSNLAS